MIQQGIYVDKKNPQDRSLWVNVLAVGKDVHSRKQIVVFRNCRAGSENKPLACPVSELTKRKLRRICYEDFGPGGLASYYG
jgi:hypothetical protein